MERIQFNGAYVACAGGGFAAGALAGWLVHRFTSARRFDERVAAETEALRQHYRARAVQLAFGKLSNARGPAVTSHSVDDVVVESDAVNTKSFGAVADPTEGLPAEEEDEVQPVDVTASGGDGDSDDEVVLSSEAAAVTPIRTPSRPYAIGPEEFSDTPEGYQTLQLTYYAADQVLTDDKDEPIYHVVKTVGPLTALDFGGISGDPHTRYVRNELLNTDFEIILKAGSYTELVLNYGNPRNPAQDA